MHNEHPQKLEPALYVVATPIGNLRDITLRALDVLANADVVAAEDTRNSSYLLQQHGIRAEKLLAVHQHNERSAAERLVSEIRAGRSVAFISDAGTPGVSDPGALLVQGVREAGLRVIPVPGANAAIAALSAAGLADPHFLFYGFLPAKSGARKAALQQLRNEACTLVFYEAPHRIVESVQDMASELGGARRIVLAREVTKMFESIHACMLGEAVNWLEANSDNQRGEFVVLVSGAPETEGLDQEAVRTLEILLAELPLKQAVQLASRITGANRNELYQQALALKDGKADAQPG